MVEVEKLGTFCDRATLCGDRMVEVKKLLNTPLGLRLTSTNLQLNMQVTHVHHKLAKFPQLQGSHTS